jgi:hypothetical protein
MKHAIFVLSLMAVIGVAGISSASAQKACPAGKITCEQWCSKYRNLSGNCMTGPGNSCEHKPQGAKTCVGDVPGPGRRS